MVRRVRTVDEAAVPDWVDRKNREFVYPFPEIPPFGGLGGGAGGAFSIQVAAADAAPLEIEKADLLCTGVSDHLTVLQAASILHATGANRGGRILLSSGTFNWGGGGIFLGEDIILQGMGTNETRLIEAASSTFMIETGADCVIRDLEIDTHGSTDTGLYLGDQCQVVNALFTGSPIRNIQPGNNGVITRCTQTGAGYFVDGSAGYNEVQIFNNWRGVGAIALPSGGTGWMITDNLLNGTIEGPGGSGMHGLVVEGNLWIGQPAIDIDNVHRFAIVGNVAYDIGFDFILLNDAHHGVVADNTGTNLENGIIITGSDFLNVDGNVIEFETGFGEDGIVFNSVSNSKLTDNLVIRAGLSTDNTFDAYRIDNDSNDNLIHGNKSVPAPSAGNQTRYGINIASANADNNASYSNYLGDASEYGTADYNDAGTGTINAPDANGNFTY